MSEQQAVRDLVARFLRVPAETVTAETPLHGFEERSMEWFGLTAALQRRFHSPNLHTVPPTVAALEAIVLGNGNGHGKAPASNPPAPVVLQSRTSGSLPRIGIDIEEVDSLPDAGDYWEHEFYRTAFTNAEIAYCLSQERPRMHFAGLWAAKEALLKCGGTFSKDQFGTVEVAHQPSGQPFFRRGQDAVRLPCALSIAHTKSAAVAVVTEVPMPAAAPAPVTPTSPAVAAAPARSSVPAILAIALAAASLLTSLVALLRR